MTESKCPVRAEQLAEREQFFRGHIYLDSKRRAIAGVSVIAYAATVASLLFGKFYKVDGLEIFGNILAGTWTSSTPVSWAVVEEMVPRRGD